MASSDDDWNDTGWNPQLDVVDRVDDGSDLFGDDSADDWNNTGENDGRASPHLDGDRPVVAPVAPADAARHADAIVPFVAAADAAILVHPATDRLLVKRHSIVSITIIELIKGVLHLTQAARAIA